ncbi:MAG: hypothetical protein COB37_03175 [Kordiimonadales bacterium]|nr:MAG: hypothetical protein COB37_03175 [Kordiimonadales bacterium]
MDTTDGPAKTKPEPVANTAAAPACTTSYYNGACPICRSEMMRYKRHGEKAGAALNWVDISKPENADALKDYAITQDMAYRRIYTIGADGKPAAGVDGLIKIWTEIPRWRWLATVLKWPVIHPVTAWLYEHVLARAIYDWNRYRMRRTEQKQAEKHP